MKKVSIVAGKQSRKTSEQKLTVGLDLGDRSSWYCVLGESGAVVLEQRLSTTPKGVMKERQSVQGGRPEMRRNRGSIYSHLQCWWCSWSCCIGCGASVFRRTYPGMLSVRSHEAP